MTIVPFVRTLFVTFVLLAASSAGAEIFVVSNTDVSGAGSLRQAILNANATPDLDTITFAIVGAGTQTIGGSLPSITEPVFIDGYSQPLSSASTATDGTTNATLRIRLDGDAIRAGDAVLTIVSSQVIVRGIIIGDIKAGGAAVHVGSKASNVQILGCFLGVSASGFGDDSDGTGVLVEGTATIGSPLPEDRNLISGNDTAGILISGDNSIVQNNSIGTDRDGEPTLGNGVGVQLESDGSILNLIGGLEEGNGNDIAGNTGAGIRAVLGAAHGNHFEHNRIRDNGGLGIDLGPEGVTANDEGDIDGGPNHLQNFPELDFARINENLLRVQGFLESKPGEYYLEFFRSIETDPSGYGEGAAYAGSILVEIAEGQTIGSFAATVDLGAPVALPFFVTATAESVEFQETSEFSRAIAVTDGGQVLTVVNTNDSGEGSLRAALEAANADPDPNTILFSIPGAGPHTIQPLSVLAIDEAPVVIDGYSEPGSKPNTLVSGTNAVLRIAIDGSGLEAEAAVLDVLRTSATIRGLAVHSAPKAAIRGVESEGLVIEGNFLGTDIAGMVDLGNGENGIDTGQSIDARIGGVSRGNRNLISGNGGRGILDVGEGTAILNNIIGANAPGTGDLGNGLDGIRASGLVTTIGSDDAGQGNLIRGNGGDGIEVASDSSSVLIRGNAILENDALGIDLLEAGNAAGVTPNDEGDADGGANELQNFPELTELKAFPGTLTVEGTLDVPDGTYTIRIFQSATCDPSGHGEGALFVGAADVVLAAGEESFSFELPAIIGDVVQITATATDAGVGNTSEFSPCIAVGGETPLCGDASLDGELTASDALLVLKVAVGSGQCDLCICDVNGTGTITSPDALLVLKFAVGQSVVLDCPVCG